MDRVHSTSNLPQRRWGSSGAQDQRSVRPTTASQRPAVYSGGNRPMSGRPVSGYGNRLQSRPTTALSAQKPPPPLFLHEPKSGSSTQLPNRLRPGSAVRPLSGRIFLRKTQEKGWIAKNVPEASYEGLEIEDYDDIYDDTESVDSFFDDDFDTEEQDEKLQRLLTCTTLGVASKGHKQDYVSGEISVPKFHCPRCRDHYYGLTPYPCDEELARLIREGLWRTGEATSPDKSIRRGMMRTSLSETNIQKNKKSNSSKDMESSSKIKLPPLNTNNSNMTSSHDAIHGNKDGSISATGGHNKKRTKKISFALDNDYGGASPSTSEASLTGRDDGSNIGRKRRIGDDRKKGSLGANKGSLTGLNDTSDAGSNSSLDRYRMPGHQKKSDNQSSTSKLIDSQTKDGGHSGSLSASGSNKDATSTRNVASGLDDETGNTKGKGLGGTNTDASRNSSTMLIDEATMTDLAADCSNGAGTGSSSRNTANGSGSTRDDGNASAGSKYGNKSSEATDSGNRKKCNVVNCQNNSNSFNKSSAADDDGSSKKKAPPGYMRAASPSQSEWADPTHAKKWINNVAPPHPTFRYNNDNTDDYDDEFSGQVFKPRGWHLQKRSTAKSEPMDDPLLLPVGPKFTRAFTFSYMPGSGGGTKASGSNSAAGGSKKSSRKKTS